MGGSPLKKEKNTFHNHRKHTFHNHRNFYTIAFFIILFAKIFCWSHKNSTISIEIINFSNKMKTEFYMNISEKLTLVLNRFIE